MQQSIPQKLTTVIAELSEGRAIALSISRTPSHVEEQIDSSVQVCDGSGKLLIAFNVCLQCYHLGSFVPPPF